MLQEIKKFSALFNINCRSGQLHVFPLDGHVGKFSQLFLERLLLLLLFVLRQIVLKNFSVSGLCFAVIYLHFVVNLFNKFDLELLLLGCDHLLVTNVGVISASSIFRSH